MADSFLVLVPHKTLHGTISILIQRPKLATNVGKMGAVKNKMPFIPRWNVGVVEAYNDVIADHGLAYKSLAMTPEQSATGGENWPSPRQFTTNSSLRTATSAFQNFIVTCHLPSTHVGQDIWARGPQQGCSSSDVINRLIINLMFETDAYAALSALADSADINWPVIVYRR